MSENQNSTSASSSNSSSKGLIILVIALAFFAGYLWNKTKSLEEKQKQQPKEQKQQVDNSQQNQEQEKNLKIKRPNSKEDHWFGDKNARYVWVGYSDFQCPYCKNIHSNLIKVMSEYKGKVAWVFRQFPLQGHPKAQKSAEASECANDLSGNDGFWKMTNLIFEKMPEMELTDLPNMAVQIGLNKNKFQSCLDSSKYEKKVKDQLSEGEGIGIQGTPTSVIYDLKTGKSKTIGGALPYEALKKAIDEFIKS